MSRRVIAAGTLCLDITPVFNPQKTGRLSELAAPGTLVRMEAADVHTGGSVANTGLALKRLGVETELVAKIGLDPFGDIVTGILANYNAASGLIHDSASTTSYSVVLAPPGVDRCFLHHPGANDSFESNDVSDDRLQGAALLHFGYPPLMRRMYQAEGGELIDLFRRAKAAGVATSLDLAAVDPHSEAGQVDWRALLQRLTPLVDFFLPSAEELCFMIDPPRYREWVKRAGNQSITDVLDMERDVAPLADRLIQDGAKVVLIKCGASGMYLRTAGSEALKAVGAGAWLDVDTWANRSQMIRGYKAARVLSGTGAGDTSIAAFLASMLEGRTPDVCAERAAATGACCVEAYDALSGILPFDQLDARIANGWEKSL